MRNIFAWMMIVLGCGSVQAQNIEGQIIASQYGQWKVPGYAPNTYSSFAPTSCRVQGGASFFFAFNVGTPITIVDSNPALSETLTPTAIVDSNVSCAVTIAPVNNHQVPFFLTSATGGLQEALDQNLTSPAANTVVLSTQWYQQVAATNGNPATILSTVQGNANLNLVDITTTPYNWYKWNGTQYVLVPLGGGSAGNLGTLQNDALSNNATNTAAQDIYNFYATSTFSPAAAVAAAQAHGGIATIMPSVGRSVFTNTGNVRVVDNRTDVPATARGVTEFGANCDTQSIQVTFTQGSTAFAAGYTTLSQANVGMDIVAVGSVAGVPTVFESAIATITDSLHGTVTTAFPFTQATAHVVDLGHDDTAAIAQGMTAVGHGGTLLFPQGVCLTHTQTLAGQSPVGVGPNTFITSMPGEDIFAAPDPSLTQGLNQGAAHIHDLSFLLDLRIDATKPWQRMVEGTTTNFPGLYRPIATRSGVANNPGAPGWFQGSGANHSGATNGVAAMVNGSAVMCVNSTYPLPAVGQQVVFPYGTTVFTTTIASTAGSCGTGNIARTMAVTYPGITFGQTEFFAGSSAQNLATSITSGSCPATITLTNPIGPNPSAESNVAAAGLIQIDSEQFHYFGKSDAGNPTPANTLYNIQCAQNGTSRATHAVGATVVPLNPFKPSYPWPVIPTINAGDTTPLGTAGYFPGWNVGNAVFAFPVANGQVAFDYGAWGPNSRIENISAFQYPNDVNGLNWNAVNNGAMFYFVSPPYGTKFSNISDLYLFYGLTEGTPSIENGNWSIGQPTADGTSWDQVALWDANPVNMTTGGQNSYSNFNVYSSEGQISSGAGLGADTCFYFTQTGNDQTGAIVGAISNTEFHNLYCEPEGGTHAETFPNWEWDTYGGQIYDQHMGGGGEVYIGGGDQHWYSGNFNNAPGAPMVNWGVRNTSDYASNLGSEPKGNIYGTDTVINYGPLAKFSGTTTQAFGTPYGPNGSVHVGGREPIRGQTAETFNTGNTTAPYSSSEGGFISPEEFNTNFAFESQAMSVPWTFDDTSPVSHSYVGCNVGNNSGAIYCATGAFNEEQLPIGPGQRLVPGKYTMYVSMKDAATATNTETFSIFSNCAGFSQSFSAPITNAWPATAAGVFTAPVDLSSMAGSSGCGFGMRFNGATTADAIEIGYVAFAPVAENLHANTITAANIVTPTSSTGGTANGCAQSPVTGINNGYTCPTIGWSTTLGSNQTPSQNTLVLASSPQMNTSGCLFVDGEYECFTGVSGTTLTGVTRAQYTTTAAAHTSGALVVSVNLVLGSPNQFPTIMVGYGGSEAPILSIDNAFPFNHGGASVFSINPGNNETWFDTAGAMHQLNSAVYNVMQGQLLVGQTLGPASKPAIQDSGYLLQSNVLGNATVPQSLGGGHAGSLNVIATPNIGAPVLGGYLGSGSSTVSWVCSGTDYDGNLIPGTTVSVTSAPATWSYPTGITVQCPWSAGVNTFQIYRTAGGGSQGLLASGTGPGFAVSDYGGATSGGTPPSSNASNPHISVAGTGNPTITMGTATLTMAAAAPSGTCVSGSLWTNSSGGASTTLYVCVSAAWNAVTIP